MPISSFYGLQTSLRGLVAQQRSIDVTGHNIANASTVGYSRQEATLAASAALQLPAGGVQSGSGAHLGSGVDVQSYRRLRDGFLDIQYRTQAMSHGEHEARASALDRAELSLAEPSADGINAQLGRFWNAWADLANAPESPAARQALVSRAAALGTAFATVDAQLATVGAQADQEYAMLAGPGGERGAVAGGEGLAVAADHRQGDVDALTGAGDRADVRRVQQRQVGRADEGVRRAVLQGGEAARHALEGSLRAGGVLDDLDGRRQWRQVLAAGADDDHRTVDAPGHEAGDTAQQRGAVPLQARLGLTHPRRAAPGQHDCCGRGHAPAYVRAGAPAAREPRTTRSRSSASVAAVTSSTARSKASRLCGAGERIPEILRTYCSAAARTSSGVTDSVYGGRRVWMLRHMRGPYASSGGSSGPSLGCSGPVTDP